MKRAILLVALNTRAGVSDEAAPGRTYDQPISSRVTIVPEFRTFF